MQVFAHCKSHHPTDCVIHYKIIIMITVMTGHGLPLFPMLVCNSYVDMLCSCLVQVESAYFCSLIASADEYGVFVYDPEE